MVLMPAGGNLSRSYRVGSGCRASWNQGCGGSATGALLREAQEGQVQDAEELRARVLADFPRVLGASHPDLAQLHKWQRINRDLEPQQI